MQQKMAPKEAEVVDQGENEVDLPQQLLNILDKEGGFDSIKLAAKLNLAHQKVIGAVKSLLTHEGVSSCIQGSSLSMLFSAHRDC